ncbi:IS110 family transposase [Paramicrobacterium chengjingii]|uniref:IS110 family transposase n=1 Tax=Paramicrobacterium chengjingii TaxID=2769067 RepID=A0ABX6YGQ8_9MICO|nr:IS110 family transposase [Microbacterium chengjingii]QPZ37590.1 IS110 family transposase [Microbacterium chengjingii]
MEPTSFGSPITAYLPGLAMRKAAQLLPGDAKTDARDAFVIATTALKMPDTLRTVDRDSEVLASLKVLAGYDDDLARDCTRQINRIRSLLLQIHPALERVFTGTRLTTQLSLDLLARYGGPTALITAGRARVKAWARKTKHRGVDALVDDVFTALSEQSAVVIGTAAAEKIIPRVANQIAALKKQRRELAAEVEELLDAFPLREVLISMLGIGTKTAATILLTIGDGSTFPTAGHLAAYAGIAPVTRRSGKSIRGEHPARSGNKQLKNALFRSAWVASNCDPESAAYYQRRRTQGKKHNAAAISLAPLTNIALFLRLHPRTAANIARIEVELARGFTRGQTVIDRRRRTGEADEHNLATPIARSDAAVTVNAPAVAELYLTTLLNR